jgi:hypothetical protein
VYGDRIHPLESIRQNYAGKLGTPKMRENWGAAPPHVSTAQKGTLKRREYKSLLSPIERETGVRPMSNQIKMP